MPKQMTPVISTQWIRAQIRNSIYINDAVSLPQIAPSRVLPKKVVERELPYANPLRLPHKGPVTDRILEILLSSKVRRGSKTMIEPFLDTIRTMINRSVRHSQPVSFILPALPFKDQSPFTTRAAIDHTDLAEYSFFAQLRRVMDAIREVYPPGAHCTILCDGFVYADIFANGNSKGAGKYKAQCEKLKNIFGLYNEVTLFDMREILFDFPEWPVVHDVVQRTIEGLLQSDSDVASRVESLSKKFMYHVQFPGISYEDARERFGQHPWPVEITERLRRSAVLYAALQLTLKKTDLVRRAFPAAIRCTVHPKPAAQIPLHLTNAHNQLLPYNGVATVSRSALEHGASLFESLRIKRLCDVYNLPNVTAMYVEKEKDPYYYETA